MLYTSPHAFSINDHYMYLPPILRLRRILPTCCLAHPHCVTDCFATHSVPPSPLPLSSLPLSLSLSPLSPPSLSLSPLSPPPLSLSLFLSLSLSLFPPSIENICSGIWRGAVINTYEAELSDEVYLHVYPRLSKTPYLWSQRLDFFSFQTSNTSDKIISLCSSGAFYIIY